MMVRLLNRFSTKASAIKGYNRSGLYLSVALLGFAMVGCGEKSQDLAKAPAGSSVTRDTRAYEGDSSKYALTTFKRGDKTAWETHMKTRMQGQDEYSREK
jgi:hypothetical protein